MKVPVAYDSVKYLAGPEQVRLSDELAQSSRAHPFRQRRLPPLFMTGTIFKNVQLVHCFLVLPDRLHAPHHPLSKGSASFTPKIQLSKDKPNFKENVQIFQLFAVKQRCFLIFRPPCLLHRRLSMPSPSIFPFAT
jgi:hypothetical protein